MLGILGEFAFVGDGDTIEEAINNLNEVKGVLFEEYIEKGLVIKEPEKEEPEFSGKFLVRVPKKLHRDLVYQAKENDISLNQFIVYLLTKALEFNSTQGLFEKYFAGVDKSKNSTNVQYKKSISAKHVADSNVKGNIYSARKDKKS